MGINGKGGLLLWLSSWWLKGRCRVRYGMDLVLFQSEKDICFAVSHIRVNFPGADASQQGDLFIPCGGCLGRSGSCAVLLAQLMRSHGNTGLQETLYFHFGSCCVWLTRHIYIRWRGTLFWNNTPRGKKGSVTLRKGLVRESFLSSFSSAVLSSERSSRGTTLTS